MYDERQSGIASAAANTMNLLIAHRLLLHVSPAGKVHYCTGQTTWHSPTYCTRRRTSRRAGTLQVAASSSTWRQVDELLVGKLRHIAQWDIQAAGTVESEGQAVQLVRGMKESGAVRAFAAGRQIPKRNYTLDELKMNGIEPMKYLSPRDNTLNSVRTTLQVAFVVGLTAMYATQLINFNQVLITVVGVFFLLAVDQVAASGGFEALLVDSAGRFLSSSYSRRVALHEAGHFLVAYLLGLLPKAYTLTSLDAYLRSRALNVQAGTQFCDTEFQAEVRSGKLSSSSLSIFACVALAGVATEYLRFGQAEGGIGDVLQLDALLKALQFTPKKAEGEVRYAVVNTTLLLKEHAAVQDLLAQAMAQGKSVGECCNLIECNIDQNALMPASLSDSVATDGGLST